MKMIKQIWKRIKAFFKKIKNRWKELRRIPTDKEIFEHLFNWICDKRPEHLEYICPVCGARICVEG